MSKKGKTDSRRPKPPTIHETRLALAETGQYEELLKILKDTPWTFLDVEETWGLILRAMEVRSKENPEKFASDIFAAMVTFSSFLLMRVQFILGLRIAQHGQMMRTRGHVDFAPNIYEKHFPRLVELQGHVAELLQCQAATARAWQLTRRGRIKNDRTERASRRETRRCTDQGAAHAGAAMVANPADPKHTRDVVVANGHAMPTSTNVVANGHSMPTSTNGKPVNRINKLLDGLGSGHGEAPHED